MLPLLNQSTEALLRLESVSFEGAGSYVTLPEPLRLAKRGRVLIAGNEGAGKSMIPEVVTLVLYGKGSPRVRSTAFTERSLMNPITGYQGTITGEVGIGAASRRVAITQAFKHKTLKSRYIIAVDGKREEPETKPQQRKRVNQIVPISYDEWLGIAYLYQGGVHDLLAGSPTEKRAYLTGVFGLNFFEDLIITAIERQKHLERKATGAVEATQRLVDVTEELSQAQRALAALPQRAEVDAGLQKLKARIQHAATAVGEVRATRDAIARRATMEASLASVMGKRGWTSIPDFKEQLRGLYEQKAALQEQTKQAARLSASRQTAHDKFQTAQARAAQLKNALADARTKAAPYEALVGLEVETRDVVNALSRVPKDVVVEVGAGEAASREDVDQLHAFTRVLEIETQCCPTCTRPLSDADRASFAEQISLLRLRVGASLAREYPFLPKGTVAEARAWLEEGAYAVLAVERSASQYQKALLTLADASTALEQTPKPPKITTLESSLAACVETLSSVEAQARDAEMAAKLEHALRAMPTDDAEETGEILASLQTRLADLTSRQQAAASILSQVDSTEATVRALEKQKQQAEVATLAMASAAEQAQRYGDVLVPYFKTLRASKVRGCVSVLEAVLPAYISAMTSAQYTGATAKLEVSEDLQSIDLRLRPSETAQWLSGFQASGGQRRRFTLAIQAALREVSPRQANIMFFDEPFSDLESEGKHLFVNRLLPLMLERCPGLESVFIIAHDKEVLESSNQAFDEAWRVTGPKGGSTITTGLRLSDLKG
jgi:DNA repair exonuclease SbcCD ATPase subunit